MSAKSSAGATILKAWLLAGTLDITAAIIVALLKGYSPVLIFRYIASAVFGTAATANGWEMVVVGLLFHYGIALIWSSVFYYIAYPLLHRYIKNAAAAGLLYGLIVWLVMNLLIVPASRIPARPFVWTAAIREMVILIICIGLPIAIITYRNRTNNTQAGVS